MDHIEGLKLLYKDVSNVDIYIENELISFCGSCPSMRISSVVCKIREPKSWDKLQHILDTIDLNVNIKKNYPQIVTKALYKKDGFDKAFEAMKILKPELTEFDFAFTCGYYIDGMDEPDYDLVTEKIYQEDNCIRNYDGSVYTYEGVDNSIFTMESIQVKVELNEIEKYLDQLHEIISTQI